MNEIRAQRRWRLFGGITIAVLFVAVLIVHIAGKTEFDAVALTLFVCVVGSIAFALSHQLGIAKIAAGPFEVEIKPLIKQAVAELPPKQAGEVWKVLKKHSSLFPVIGVRLLWIDDRPEKLILQRRLLRRLGVEIVMVKSTEAAKAELKQDGDFALIIQDRLRATSGDARALVEWLNTKGAEYGVGKVPLVVYSWDPFDISVGVKEWNWITKDFASLLDRIADEVQQWKKHLPAIPNKSSATPRFEEIARAKEEALMEHEREDNTKRRPQTIPMNVADLQASAHPITPWRSYSFAPEWFEDALVEARTGRDHHSRRREILYAVCCVESYLFEWVRDEVLNRKFDELGQYFPYGDRRGIRDRWKEVIKDLQKENRIREAPDFGLSYWVDFRDLVEYRDGLVHGKSSRPETSSLKDEHKPVPSKDTLDQLPTGWAVRVIVKLIRRLHDAVGTSTPSWLVEP